MSSLKKQTISGIKWQLTSGFLNKGISMAATIVLARLLSPSVFGLFALAFVAIDALGLFKSMGFDTALIRRREDIEKAANTAFFIIPILGLLLYAILAISAPFIGKFLNNQDVVGIIRALGVIFVISCFGKVPAALLEKNMHFKKVSIIAISTAIVYAVSAVTFAILGFGVWSLVLAYILKMLNHNIMAFIFCKWHPRFEFDKRIALEMFHFGKFIFLSSVIWFLKMNLDNILVGRLLGVYALGLYAIAFNIANFGADYFGGTVHRVIFPAFSKIQSDKDDLKQAFLKTTKLIAIFAFPFCAGMFLLSDELIKVVYGTAWVAAVPVLKVLAFAGLFNTLPVAMGPLFNASGYPKTGFWFGTIQVAIFFTLIAPVAKLYGIIGVGLVVALSQLTAALLYLPFTMRLVSLTMKDIYLCLKPGLVASLCMGFTIFAFKYITAVGNFIGSNLYFTFAIYILSSVVSYVLFLWIIDRNILGELKGIAVRA